MARERKPRGPHGFQRGPRQLKERQERLLPLPRSTARMVQRHRREANGGLLFDKYMKLSPSRFDQKMQQEILRFAAEDAKQSWQRLTWERILDRHRALLRDLGARIFSATTASPLCLHLSRTGVVENAGIALHPVWGTPYIPGTALKGMARRYASNVWKLRQPDPVQAQATIDAIFGYAAEDGRAEADRSDSAAGSVIFLEAWPVELQQIQLDIINTHYPHYYQGNDPPGDWDEPQPVYFPAIPAGTPFLFAVAPRNPSVPAEHLDLASEWLREALSWLGVGAKTAAGYGRMTTEQAIAPPPEAGSQWTGCQIELKLDSPAFLGGADPGNPADCRLRGTALRGLLRWWWRALHAGYVTPAQLKAMETSIWGSTEHASPIALHVEPIDVPDAELFDRNAIIRQYGLEPPRPSDTPGLTYITYGLAEGRRRWYMPSGARWRLILTAQPTRYRSSALRREWSLSAEEVLQQARIALWLLTTYGGVGAKTRKGFGSFALPQELASFSLQQVLDLSASLRRTCGFPARHYDDAKVQSPCLAAALQAKPPLEPVTIDLGKQQVWPALNSLGDRIRRFVRSVPKDDRRGLGMPRRLRVRGQLLFHPGRHVERTGRHAAPVWFHLIAGPEGYSARATFFPAPELPSLAASRDLLRRYREYLLHLGQAPELR